MRRRVLIISASMGAGHDRAAAELGRRLASTGHDYEIVNFLKLLPWGLGELLRRTYEFQLRRCAWTYELGYRLLGSAGVALWHLNVFLCSGLTRRSIRRTLDATEPDIVVSTYPFASLVLGHLRRTRQLRVPVATYLTDFAVHPLWVHYGVDLHMAVSEESARTAVRRGAGAATSTGPLVRDQFRTARRSRPEVRRALGIPDDARVTLVVAGSLGFGAVPDVVDGIRGCGDYHVIAVCGNNAKLQTTLIKAGTGGTILGWTDEMPELMGASDVLVENAGGLTAMEAFAAGLPVVSYQPIAGHGRDNARAMSVAGVSRYARRPGELGDALAEATTPGPARDALIQAGQGLFADDPARLVVNLAVPTDGSPVLARSRRSTRQLVTAALRAPSRVPTVPRVAALALVAVVGLYGVMTEGAETVAALGGGVAKAPAGVHGTTYLGVRLTATELRDGHVLAAIRGLDATAVVDGRTALGSGRGLATLATEGIDLGNGGWGVHTMLPWTRASKDCGAAGRVLAQRAHVKPDVFVPGRELNGFDQIYCRTGRYRTRLVLPNATLHTDRAIDRVIDKHIYLLDGRNGNVHALRAALASFRSRVGAAGLRSRPLRDLR